MIIIEGNQLIQQSHVHMEQAGLISDKGETKCNNTTKRYKKSLTLMLS